MKKEGRVPRRAGGALLSNGPLGMCRWVGLHFHDLTDYRVAFSGLFNRYYSRVALSRDFESKNIICLKVTEMGSINEMART